MSEIPYKTLEQVEETIRKYESSAKMTLEEYRKTPNYSRGGASMWEDQIKLREKLLAQRESKQAPTLKEWLEEPAQQAKIQEAIAWIGHDDANLLPPYVLLQQLHREKILSQSPGPHLRFPVFAECADGRTRALLFHSENEGKAPDLVTLTERQVKEIDDGFRFMRESGMLDRWFGDEEEEEVER